MEEQNIKPKHDYALQGKKNRSAGARFERVVRADRIKHGWFMDKWTNNLQLYCKFCKEKAATKDHKAFCPVCGRLEHGEYYYDGIITARSRFNMRTNGFPDFLSFKNDTNGLYIVNGIEVKSNGYLTPEEKEKCKWYLKNKIFAKLFIAKKGTRRGEIIYNEFTMEETKK